MIDEIKIENIISKVGINTLLTAVLTLIIMKIVKVILNKTLKINNMDATRKDNILSRVGRLIVIITYISVYVINVIFIEKTNININIQEILFLIRGIIYSLIITKGIYTSIRQMEKKEDVYEKLEIANSLVNELNDKLNKNNNKFWEDGE